VIGAEVDLVLGQDHPVGQLPTHIALLELQAVRNRRAGQRDGDCRARAEVPRAADDLAGVALPHIHAAELEPVRVRMLLGLEHLPDEEAAEVPVRVRHPAGDDPVDLAAREHETTGQLLDGQVERDVLAQPGNRDLHG
jgi:hypothetical protein